MPKENVVILYGQMICPPQIYIDKEGTPVRAALSLKVLRRPFLGEKNFNDKLYFDCPVISTKNEQLIADISKLEESDMVEVKGVLSTKEVKKVSICPKCQAKVSRSGTSVYVTPIYISKRESGVSPQKGLELLKTRSEISNLTMIIGTLCRDPEYRESENGGRFAQYQIAINRKYRIREDDPTKKTDYPYVKTFGEQALKDSRGLVTGSIVYISGGIQTRSISRKEICENCQEEYVWEERVAEIVPYSTEYLANCVLSEEEETHAAKEEVTNKSETFRKGKDLE